MGRSAAATRSALTLGGTRIFVNLLNLVSMLVLARLLTPADFGIVAIATTVLTIILTATELSLYAALVQLETTTRAHIDTAWSMALIRAGLILGCMIAAAWPLALAYGDTGLFPVLAISGFTGALMGLHNPLIVLETKAMNFGPLIAFQIIGKVVTVGCAVALALMFHSFWSIIIGSAIGALVASLLSYLIVPYRPRLNLTLAGEIWGYSGWLSIKQLVETISWRIDQLILSLMIPRAQLGIYSVADNLAAMPTREALSPLNQVMFAGMADLKGDRSRLTASYLRAQTVVGLFCMPIGFGLVFVAAPVVKIALGGKWLDCIPFVQVLGLAYALSGLTPFTECLALALGKTRLAFVRQLCLLVCRVPLVLIGILVAGPIGAAWGGLASTFARLAIDLVLAKKMLGLTWWQQIQPHGTMLGGLAVMSAAVTIAGETVDRLAGDSSLLQLALLIMIGCIGYTSGLAMLWLLSGRSNAAVSTAVSLIGHLLPGRLATRKPG